MKPFDLNKALAGEPVVSGNSCHPLTARIICFNKKSSDNQTIVFLVENNGQEIITTCNKDGNNAWGHPVIFMAPVKRQEWRNIYKGKNSGKLTVNPARYASYEDAIAYEYEDMDQNNFDFIHPVKIHEWEE